MISVSDVLYGYCGGYFGDVYDNVIVVAVARKWIVVRRFDSDDFYFHTSNNVHADLFKYLSPNDEDQS